MSHGARLFELPASRSSAAVLGRVVVHDALRSRKSVTGCNVRCPEHAAPVEVCFGPTNGRCETMGWGASRLHRCDGFG